MSQGFAIYRHHYTENGGNMLENVWSDVDSQLQGRNRNSRKVGNNTYFVRGNDGEYDREGLASAADVIHLRLHKTFIVTYRPDNSVSLNSGGWRTVTTKARLNEHLRRYGLNVHQNKGDWYVSVGGIPYVWNDETHTSDRNPNVKTYAFSDHMRVYPDGRVEGASEYVPGATNKLKHAIKRYVDEYMRRFDAGEIPAPSAGDCWFCSMFAQKGNPSADHVLSHIGIQPDDNGETELYFVPSLLVRAIEMFPIAPVGNWYIGARWDTTASDEQRETAKRASGDWGKRQVRQSFYRYIKRSVGLAA